MIIRSLHISHLRNHQDTVLEFVQGVNILHGLNGVGKTTVLEAVSLCGFTKSFLPTQDSILVTNGADGYSVSGQCESDLVIPYKITVSFFGKKVIRSSHGDGLSPKDVIGEIPMVILSPDFKMITFGTPNDRRAFLDRLLSQCSRRYFEELNNLRRILKQRNNLLAAKSGYFDKALFEVWTDQLLQCSAEIILRRNAFVQEFTPYFETAYAHISAGGEQVSVLYEPFGITLQQTTPNKPDVIDVLRILAKEVEEDEKRRGVSLFGPQKDELTITINNGVAKDYASQGQHKSLLIAIKSAEFEYLKNVRNETPILLLDDVFSELDIQRTERVFDTIIAHAKQTFITTTEGGRLTDFIPESTATKYFTVESGSVTEDSLLL
ncbi:MAG: DNA replication/repair protein RecF [Candidatus Kapaibacterium sp.]|nr:DNA replication/repair protein RecF [Bacteroidota bacterium]